MHSVALSSEEPRERVEILACETCGGKAELDAQGQTRGQRLLTLLREARSVFARAPEGALRQAGEVEITVSGSTCLWACQRSCAVHLRSAGKAGYVLCDLEPNQASAQGLFDYATLYGQSAEGAVPYKQWPEALRGHFLCRVPSLLAPPRARFDTLPASLSEPSKKETP